VAARHPGLGLESQARRQAPLDKDRETLVLAPVDIDQNRARVIALVGGRALVLGDDLGPPGRDRPGAGRGRAFRQTRKSRRDRQDRGGLRDCRSDSYSA